MTTRWAARLKSVIRSRHLTQVRVAEALNVTPQTVSKWIKGGEITQAKLLELGSLLQVNWVWLRYGDTAVKACLSEVGKRDRLTTITDSFIADGMISDRRISATLTLLNVGFWTSDYRGGETYWSPTMKIIHRIEAKSPSIFGTYRETIHRDDLMRVTEAFRAILLHDANDLNVRYRLRRASSTTIINIAKALRSADGKLERLSGICFNTNLLAQ